MTSCVIYICKAVDSFKQWRQLESFYNDISDYLFLRGYDHKWNLTNVLGEARFVVHMFDCGRFSCKYQLDRLVFELRGVFSGDIDYIFAGGEDEDE